MAEEIEENLVLNIEKALEAIDQFAKAFEQSVAAFSATLSDALTQVFASSQSVQAELELDPGDSGDVIQDAIGDEQVTSVTFEDTNASDVGEEVQSELSSTTPEPISLPLEGEDAGLSETVEDALSDPNVPEIELPVGADTSEALSETSALEDEIASIDSVIDIEADTAGLDEAQAAIDAIANVDAINLGINPEDAKELEKVKDETVKINEAAPQASLSVKDLGGALTIAAAAAKVAAAAFAAASAASTGMFLAAVANDSAARSFEVSVGTLAPSLAKVDAAGLSIDLRQLAQNLGSSDEAALGVSQKFGQLGLTSNATSERIATANSQLFAVAANLRSLNPSLGDLDAIATSAGSAFQRGGRQAAALGLNLSTAQIRARAYADTQKGANEQLTQFDLFAAGAALAAEQFGDSIATNVGAALDDPTIRLARLKQIFGDALEQFGKPLVAPVFTVLDAGMPAALAFSEVMSGLAQLVLPTVTKVVETLAPLFTDLAEQISRSVSRMKPAAESAGEAIAVLAKAFANVATSATGPLLALLEGYAVVLQIVADVVVEAGEGVLTFAIALGAAAKAFKVISLAFAANPFGLILGGIALAVTAIVGFTSRTKEATSTFTDLTDGIFENVETIEGLTEAIQKYLGTIEAFIVKSRILKDPELVESLNELSISAETFSSWINGGREGLEDFAELLLEDVPEGARVSNAQLKAVQEGIESLTDAELETLVTEMEEYGTTTGKVGRNLVDLQAELNRTSKAKLDELVVTNRLSNAEKERILQTIEAEGEEGNYTRALELGNEVLEARAKNEADAAEAYRNSAEGQRKYEEANKSLTREVVLGIATAENFEDAIANVGIEVEDSAALFQELSDQFKEFSTLVASNVPSLINAFSRLGEDGINSNIILDEFEKSIDATNDWSNNLVRFASENKTALLQISAELGPERTRLLIDGYKGNEEALNDHLFRMQIIELNARAEAEVAAKIGFLQQRELYSGEYEALAVLLRDKAFFGPLTREDLDQALVEVETFTPEFGEAGQGVGTAYSAGVGEGIERGEQAGQVALRNAIAATRGGGEEAASVAGRETGNAIGVSLESGLRQALGPIQGLLVSKVLEAGFVAVANATPVGAQIANTLMGAWLAAILGKSNEVVRGVVAVVEETGIQGRPAASSTGTDLGEDVTGGIIAGANSRRLELLVAIGELLGGAAEANELAAYTAGLDLGRSLMDGLADGIARNVGRAAEAAARAVREAEDAARLEAESDSPSKAWERLGRDLVAGLSNGLNAASGIAARAASGVVSSANGAAGSVTNSNISVTVPVTINGDADPSMGRQIGQAAAAELRSVLRLEARVS